MLSLRQAIRMDHMGSRSFPPAFRRSLPVTVLLLLATIGPADAQNAPASPDARTPANAAPARPAGKPATRQRLELPAAEKQAIDARADAATLPAPSPSDELVPSEADAKAPPPEEPVTRIEQVRNNNRISEIRVTPALTGRTYTMTNREGQQPISATESLSGLSVPKFFTFEFGRPVERPAPPLPPPPSSQSR